MDRFVTRRRAQADQPSGNIDDSREAVEEPPEIVGVDSNGSAAGGESSPSPQATATKKTLPFMGMKVRRRANLLRECHGDYIDVPSDPDLSRILRKHGDGKVLFADKVLRFTGTGKIKRRILLITDLAIYIIDPDSDVLKRRIALAAVDKLCMKIVNTLLQATKSKSEYELKVFRLNRFEYNAAADMVKEVEFEEVDGNVRTKFTRKENH